METRILIAEGQRLIREGLREILQSRSHLQIVAEASDGAEAVRLALKTEPHVALVAVLLPRLSGIDVIREISTKAKHIRCIALAGSENRSQVHHALRSGAAGCLVTSASSEELVRAIDLVRAGSSYLSPSIASQVIDALARPSSQPEIGGLGLTAREREVLQLIAEGLTSKEIATTLGVATKTVDAHRANLMSKLGIHKASALVRYAVREGLVSA